MSQRTIAKPPGGDRAGCVQPCAGLAIRRGVTLLETIAVFGVIALLTGLLLPTVQQVRERSCRSSCANNLRQIGIALLNYEATHGHFPPKRRGASRNSPEADFGASWLAMVLPQIEHDDLWRITLSAFQTGEPPWRCPPHDALVKVIPAFDCPSDGRCRLPKVGPDGLTGAYTAYLGVDGAGPMGGTGVLMRYESIRAVEILDGASQTVIVGERPPPSSFDAGWWYTDHPYHVGPDLLWPVRGASVAQPFLCTGFQGEREVYFRFGPGNADNPCDRWHYWSVHPAGANWLFADSSVRWLSYSSERILPALATRSGAELVEFPR